MHENLDASPENMEADTQAGTRQGQDKLRAELDYCRHELQRREHDLEQARRELAEARDIQEALTEQLHADKTDALQQETSAGHSAARKHAWRDKWRSMRLPSDQRALQHDIWLVQSSKWFDAQWYLTEYPDVANADLEPAEHYLRFGAHEGRDPGPSFSTAQYLRDHPDLVGRGINPLLHHLQSTRGSNAS